jgi:hypothetical protein
MPMAMWRQGVHERQREGMKEYAEPSCLCVAVGPLAAALSLAAVSNGSEQQSRVGSTPSN